MPPENIKMVVAYDGTNYYGWQRQKKYAATVEQAIQEALARMLERCGQVVAPETIKMRCAGRTDTGVHARGQVINLRLESPIAAGRLMMVLNKYLPEDIRIISSEKAPEDFDATTGAVSKWYRYTVFNKRQWYPGDLRFAAHYPYKFDDSLMWRAVRHLAGEHDFKSFAGADDDRKSTIRTLMQCDIKREEKQTHLIYFDLLGDGFLHHMVRNIAGTLLQIGQGRMDPDAIPAILEARDRNAAGPMAAPNGLCLMSVNYQQPETVSSDRDEK